jgi:hypothetical protein
MLVTVLSRYEPLIIFDGSRFFQQDSAVGKARHYPQNIFSGRNATRPFRRARIFLLPSAQAKNNIVMITMTAGVKIL